MPEQQPRRCYHRFSSAEQRFIRRHYAHSQTSCLASVLGVSVRQVNNYVLRHAGEPWTRKTAQTLSRVRSRPSALGVQARRAAGLLPPVEAP